MNFPLLSLELRKNRLAAAAVLAAFVVTLPVARLVSSVTGMEASRAFEAVLLVWMILGTPFAVALVASSAGAETASKDARESEALWPVSPARRAAASVLSAALLAAAVTAVLVASAWMFGAWGWLDTTRNPAMNWGRPFWMDSAMSPVFFAGLADALLSCWVLSYLIGHGVAGGLAGLLLTGASLTAVGLGMGLQAEHKYWGLDMGRAFVAHGVLTLVLKAAAVAMAASWRERGTRLGKTEAAALACALLFGPIAGWGVARLALRDLSSRLKPAEYYYLHSMSTESYGADAATPAARAAGTEALAVWSGAGALCLAGPDGVRELLPRSRSGLLETLFYEMRGGADAARDEKGVLWATRWDYGKIELWREKDGVMTLARRENWPHSGEFERRGGLLYLSYWSFGQGNSKSYFVRLEDFARDGLAAHAIEGLDATLRASAKESGAATPDCAPKRRCVRRGGRVWTFPGDRLQPGADAVPYVVGGKTVYLTGVTIKDQAWVMIARPDGKVEKGWPLKRDPDGAAYYTDLRILPDGTLWYAAQDEYLAYVAGADGRLGRIDWRPFAREKRKGRAPALVRLADGRAWLLWTNVIQEVSLDGRILGSHRVPPHTGWRALKSGVIVHDEGRMSFVGWDGTVKPLRAPSS